MSDVFGYFVTALNLSCILILLIIYIQLVRLVKHLEKLLDRYEPLSLPQPGSNTDLAPGRGRGDTADTIVSDGGTRA